MSITRYASALKVLLFASTFMVSAYAQETDAVYVPFIVNVNATIKAQQGEERVSKKVTANKPDTLKLFIGNTAPIRNWGGTQGKLNAPTIIKSRGNISLLLPQQSYQNAEISLYSISGRRILRSMATASEARSDIFRQSIATGIYLLSVKGINGNIFTTHLTHSGGSLNINVAFGAESVSSGWQLKKEAGNWTITVSALESGYIDSTYMLNLDLVSEQIPEQKINLNPAIGVPASRYFENPFTFTLPPETDLGFIRCDTTGRLPTENSGLRSGMSLTLTKTTIMRCARFKDGVSPNNVVMRTYIGGERLPDLPVFSIAVDPVDMFDSRVGLYMPGPNPGWEEPYRNANYWADTELPIQMDFFENGAKHEWSYPAGLRIFGNWSRANAKKSVLISFREDYGQKNLKYSLFPEYPNLTKFKHFILRDNGNNFPNDYIRDMLMTSLTEGLGIEYQKGRAAIVYYNGRYYGIHNLRERVNGDYFETNYDIDEDIIDLIEVDGKEGDKVSKGSDADYQDIVSWLEKVTLDDNNMRILEQRIDVDNFTNHFQCRIYYNDRDWPGKNMKRWRVNSSPQSKWKWLMYDTDHGFGSYGKYEQPNVPMLNLVTATNGSSWPNPPSSTFMLRKLLQNESYKNAFINRFSLLLATYFTPERIKARIDALMEVIANEISLDQERWVKERSDRTASNMNSELNTIRNFGNTRSTQMQSEIGSFFSLGSPVNITLGHTGNGKIFVHNLQVLNGNATFKAYSTVPMVIKAVPDAGSRFDGWSDGVNSAERTVTVNGAMTLTARFVD